MKKIETLTPFKRMCVTIGNLPTSFVESMSYYECLCWLVDYLENTVIPTINNNAEAVIELQDAFTVLKNYVDNYFKNLDVQEEINNKLDDLVEDGTMAQIINENIFNELNTKVNTNTNNIGDLEELTTTDNSSLVNAINEIVNTLNTSLASVITNLGDLDDLETTNKDNMVNAVNEVKALADTKVTELTEIVIFGDSWSDPTSLDAIWGTDEYIGAELGLNVHNYALSGGFLSGTDSTSLEAQVNTFTSDSNVNKSLVKYIVILGGINDYRNNVTFVTLATKIEEQIAELKILCPQAKILYASNCQWYYDKIQGDYWCGVHQDIRANSKIVTYNMFGTLGYPVFNSNNYFHLTQTGQKIMMSNIIASLTGGEIQHFQQDVIVDNASGTLKYSTERVGNMVILNIKITPKQSKTDYSFSAPSGFYFNYYPQRIGVVGRVKEVGIINVGYNAITTDFNTALTTGVEYEFTSSVELSHT